MRPTSMPSSSEDVVTSPLRVPPFNPRSAAILDGLAKEPWCMETGKSTSQTLNLLARTSEMARVLVNSRTDLCFSMYSRMILSLAATSGCVNSREASS